MAGVGVFLRRVGLLVAVMVVGVLASAGVASANSYTVNSPLDVALSPSNSTTCQTATPGQCTLRAAVQAADNAGGASKITLPANTYTLTIAPTGSGEGADANDPAHGDLDVNNNDNNTSITIVGSGSSSTIINPNHIDRAFSVDNAGGLSLSGLTIENGKPAEQSTGAQGGGAIYSDGSLSLAGVTLNNNSAPYDTTTDDGGDGGAVFHDSSDLPLSVVNSTISNNSTASPSNNGAGGGILIVDASSFTVTGSTFTSNNGDEEGGAIFSEVFGAAAQINNDHFSANTTPVSGADGGALWIEDGGTVLNHDEFDNNFSAGYGGAVFWVFGSIASDGSSFIGNTAYSEGGAFDVLNIDDSPLTLTNATLSHNGSTFGGGIYFDEPTPSDLINDTVFDNNGAGGGAHGGGVFGSSNVSPYTVGVRNTIVAENSGNDCANGSGASQFSSSADAGHNLDGDSSCFAGTGAVGDKPGVNPLLAQPNDNGGPVLTDAEQSGSPAIDAGTDANCPATDARGVARPQGLSCDMGAYETTAGTGQLSAAKTAPSSAKVGKVFDYSIRVGNKGPGQSSTTTLVDQLPAHSSLHSLSTLQGSCSSSGSPAKVTCNLSTLASGSGTIVTIAVSVGKAGTVTNTASVSNDQGSSASASAKTKITKGKLVLKSRRLKVKGGRVFVPFKCTGKKPCSGSFSIVAHPGAKKPIVCAKGSFKKIKAGKSRTVSAKVRKRCLSLLGKAKHHTLKAKLTATPKTQQGVSAIVHLFLV